MPIPGRRNGKRATDLTFQIFYHVQFKRTTRAKNSVGLNNRDIGPLLKVRVLAFRTWYCQGNHDEQAWYL